MPSEREIESGPLPADENEQSTTAAVAASPVSGPTVSPARAASAGPDVRTALLFASYSALAVLLLVVVFMTVHDRTNNDLANFTRSDIAVSSWLKGGYFHYCGLLVLNPTDLAIYRSSTGGYLVSGFVVEKLYSIATGRYSPRLLGLHNQIVSALLAALLALLAFRLTRMFGLSITHAWVLGASVELLSFTFPDNLDLYWGMSAQAAFLLFAVAFLLMEERRVRGPESQAIHVLQIGVVFLMTYM
jgi:hypothetical protein